MSSPDQPGRSPLAYHDGSCCRCGAADGLLRFSEFGKAVCSQCYPGFFRRRVGAILRRYPMIRKREVIGVALSGGKDSGSLLHALWGLRDELNLRLVGLHIHMGLGEYSDASQRSVEELAARLGAPLVIERVADHGVAIAPAGTFTMCSVCGAVRRALLDRAGLREGWAAVATGHTLDDRLQQMLKRLLTGRLDAPRPVLPGDAHHPRKIKPLSQIPDRALAAYAELEGLPTVAAQCPGFQPASHRFKQVFELLEALAPMGKVQLAHALQRAMREQAPGRPEQPCSDCGNPTGSGLCPICRLRRLAAGQETPSLGRPGEG
jgi:tRNA-5-methyluridine54 2-sulfurtransferase